MKFAYGPLNELPKFSIGIGYPVEFIPYTEEKIKEEDGFTNVGQLLCLGPDFSYSEVYEKDGSYYLK
jgi:hypothetical protein